VASGTRAVPLAPAFGVPLAADIADINAVSDDGPVICSSSVIDRFLNESVIEKVRDVSSSVVIDRFLNEVAKPEVAKTEVAKTEDRTVSSSGRFLSLRCSRRDVSYLSRAASRILSACRCLLSDDSASSVS
jgi:hypothetical protein